MESLVALGLACNILQVISFCRVTIETFTDIKSSGSAQPDLAEITSKLEGLSLQLQSSISNTRRSSAPSSLPSVYSTQLLDAARDCNAAATKLRNELDAIAKSKGGVAGKTLAASRRRSRIQRLEKSLVHHQQLLNTQLLVKLWYVSYDKSAQF
jgi:hypothetical protein